MPLTEISFGALVIPVRLAVPVLAMLSSILLLRWVPLGTTEIRRYVVDVVLGAIFVFLVGWKLTPFVILWESVLRDPRVVLFAPGGAAGTVVGIAAAFGYVLRRFKRDDVPWKDAAPFFGLLGALVVALSIIGSVTAASLSSPTAGSKSATTVSLPTLNGDTIVIGEAAGIPRLVNFWATWCVPCRSETEVKRSIAERYDGQIEVIGVNLTASETSIGDVRAFVDEWGIQYPTLLDTNGRAASRFAIRGTPTSILFDAEGNIAGRYFGALSNASASRFIAPVLR
ncbi:MAG: redoxin domain-containing protein [Spirochaetaceae bacterium]